MGDTFVFSIEATYSGVGSLGNMAPISVTRMGRSYSCRASRLRVLPAEKANIWLRFRHRIF